MFLRTADENSFSNATGSTIQGGRMSTKVKTQPAKVNKYVILQPIGTYWGKNFTLCLKGRPLPSALSGTQDLGHSSSQ